MFRRKSLGWRSQNGVNATVSVPILTFVSDHDHCLSTGGLVSLSMMGQPMLVINSYKAAVDLLDKRSDM